MSFFTDDQNIGGQLKVGNGLVPAVGESLSKINGSAYIEGPMVVGGQLAFPTPYATVCIGPYANSDESPISSLAGLVPGALLPGGNHSKYSLAVDGPTALLGDLDVLKLNKGLEDDPVENIKPTTQTVKTTDKTRKSNEEEDRDTIKINATIKPKKIVEL